jgi:hypothetical protein
MDWLGIFHRGARRLADRATYAIVLVTTVVAVVPLALLSAISGDSASGAAAATLVGIVWAWLTWTFSWGALSIAALEQPHSTGASAILRATLARYATFLRVTLWLFLAVLGVGLGLVLLALVGLGDTTTAPLLAVLTPVFLVVGGVGLLVLVVVTRLAFAIVAVESASSGAAIRRAIRLMRTRPADVLFWLIGDAALVTAGVAALMSIVMTGAALAVLVQGAFFVGSALSDVVDGTVDLDAGAVAMAIWFLSLSLFGSVLAGAASSFSAGTAVAFYQAVQNVGAPRRQASSPVCSRCGAVLESDARFCDTCGLVLAPA